MATYTKEQVQGRLRQFDAMINDNDNFGPISAG
jgi:hypothetical protein